jgi:hypothetical protein
MRANKESAIPESPFRSKAKSSKELNICFDGHPSEIAAIQREYAVQLFPREMEIDPNFRHLALANL